MGSEMCIRDRVSVGVGVNTKVLSVEFSYRLVMNTNPRVEIIWGVGVRVSVGVGVSI